MDGRVFTICALCGTALFAPIVYVAYIPVAIGNTGPEVFISCVIMALVTVICGSAVFAMVADG